MTHLKDVKQFKYREVLDAAPMKIGHNHILDVVCDVFIPIMEELRELRREAYLKGM